MIPHLKTVERIYAYLNEFVEKYKFSRERKGFSMP